MKYLNIIFDHRSAVRQVCNRMSGFLHILFIPALLSAKKTLAVSVYGLTVIFTNSALAYDCPETRCEGENTFSTRRGDSRIARLCPS